MKTRTNKDISPQVAGYARALEQETGCKVVFKKRPDPTGLSASIHLVKGSRIATIYYNPLRQDIKNIQVQLAHEIGHAFLAYRDGFYLQAHRVDIPDRILQIGSQCFDIVTDVVVDRMIRGARFHPWTPDLIEEIRLKTVAAVEGNLIFENSWDAICEILHRRLAREFLTIDEEQIQLFDRYLWACQDCFPSSIVDGAEKRFNIIKQYNIFEPDGNKAAIESLLDLFGIEEYFQFWLTA